MSLKDKRPPSLTFGIGAGVVACLVLVIVALTGGSKKAADADTTTPSSPVPGTTTLASGLAQQAQPEATLNVTGPVLSVVNDAVGNSATAVAAQKEQAQKLQEQLATATSKVLNITYGDQTWKIQPAQLKKMVRIENNALEIDRKAFGDLAAGWAKTVNQKPVEPVIDWSEKENKIVATKPSKTGQKVNVDSTLDAIKAALTKGETEAVLAVEPDLPKVDSSQLDKLGIKEKISEGVSGFAGSDANRAHNIVVGTDFLDNTLVPPHGTFSFNDAIGLISKERGYADGYAIVGDITEKDVGGGICQVSTTAFRAAFWAGFTILERHEHAYRVTWYESLGEPVGFDATIYQPGLDFKFRNDTDNWILVGAYAYNSKLQVVIYGTKPDWKVDMTEGSGDAVNITTPPPTRYDVDPSMAPGSKKKVDSAHKGFDTYIGRVVKGSDGQIIRQDKFTSHYVAWPDIYKVGPSPTAGTTGTATTPAASVSPGNSPAGTTPAAPATSPVAGTTAASAPKTTTAAAPAPATTAAPPPPTTQPAANPGGGGAPPGTPKK